MGTPDGWRDGPGGHYPYSWDGWQYPVGMDGWLPGWMAPYSEDGTIVALPRMDGWVVS